MIAKHVADRSFEFNKFLLTLTQKHSMSWREVFWRIYAHTVLFHCKVCGDWFSGAYLQQCTYHP